MRILSWRLILALIIGVSLVSIASSWYEVQAQKEALRRDLDYKSATLAESLAGTAELCLATQNRAGLEQMVGRFSNREHLTGIGVYDKDESVLVITPGINSSNAGLSQLLKSAIQDNRIISTFTHLRFRRIHVLAAPLHAPDGSVEGGILVIHDAGYIRTEILRIWARVFIRVGIQVLVIAAITLVILRWSLSGPVARVAIWMRALRTGQHAVRPPSTDFDFLSTLAREVAPLAESMQKARAAAEIEAGLRNANESLWTAERLADHVRNRLGQSNLSWFLIASPISIRFGIMELWSMSRQVVLSRRSNQFFARAMGHGWLTAAAMQMLRWLTIMIASKFHPMILAIRYAACG